MLFMAVHKIIKFYVLEPAPCLTANGTTHKNFANATYSIFKSAFPEINFYDIEFEKKKLFFDIKEYDDKKIDVYKRQGGMENTCQLCTKHPVVRICIQASTPPESLDFKA